ncbi:decarboxylase [Microvirga zambiensis]|uniref:decarboxylase n=1 Tax=Microvirga zambiensis TaxID=1402137 RepID=UPI00191F5571|nr:decarboxylase [Microvirga zambiensis]
MSTNLLNDVEPLSGSRITSSLKAAGITHVLSVPDISTSDGLLWPVSRDPAFKLIRVCKEDEAIGIATGLWATGTRSVVLIQNTGFFYALNAIRVLAMEYEQPICLLIGLLLKEPDKPPQNSARYGVRLVPPVLDALGLSYSTIDTNEQADGIAAGLNSAYCHSRPHAFLLGRSPVA